MTNAVPPSSEAPRARAAVEHSSTGTGALLDRLLLVPRTPPTLPGSSVEAFQPAPAFSSYLQIGTALSFGFFFMLALVISALFFFGPWVVGIISAAISLPIIVFLAFIAFVSVRLRVDATWYVMNQRSLRVRRGIWVIRETTVTFENVQNVKVEQGPLERWFGLARVVVETAGAGAVSGGQHPQQSASQAVIEGVEHAEALRERIMQQVRASSRAGLGDEADDAPAQRNRHPSSSPQHGHGIARRAHLDVLREIRDDLRALVAPDSA